MMSSLAIVPSWQTVLRQDLARIGLAFLATAGLFYVNIMPALINGLVAGLHFSNRDAGLVGSANVYGAAAGALVAISLVRKLSWRPLSALLLLAMITLDAVSTQISSLLPLLSIRALHGLFGGTLVGLALAVIARSPNADRTFGYLLLVQFSLGPVVVMLVPPLVPIWGVNLVFWTLMLFSAVTLLMLPWLPHFPVPTASASSAQKTVTRDWRLPALILLGVFLFQAANMALFAYIIGLGQHYGLELNNISRVLGIAGWLSLLGCVLVIVLSNRWGRQRPVLLGMLVTLLGNGALFFSDNLMWFALANVLGGISWSFVIPYFFGLAASLDRSGQLATATGFASKLGLASGPLVAAYVLAGDQYPRLIGLALIGLLLCTAAVLLPLSRLESADTNRHDV